jgi:gliding motility-associated-like protein
MIIAKFPLIWRKTKVNNLCIFNTALRYVFLILIMFASIHNSYSQTTIFIDDYNRTTISPGPAPYNMTYTAVAHVVSATGTTLGSVYTSYLSSANPANQLRLNQSYSTTSANSVGKVYSYSPYNLITGTNVNKLKLMGGKLTWQFNILTRKASALDGFGTTQNAGAVILAATSSDFTAANGYAVIYIKGTTNNSVKLVRFTGGIADANFSIIASSGDLFTSDLREWQSVKVEYNPINDEWMLYARNDASVADYGYGDLATLTSQTGTNTIDNTYTNVDMTHFGFYFNHTGASSASGASSIRIDNFSIGMGPNSNSQASGLSMPIGGSSSATINWTRGNGNKVAVFIKEGSLTSSAIAPSYGSKFTANTDWAIKGTELSTGSGWYCVYNGTGTSVDLTNLTANTPYTAQVVEYLGNDLFATNYYSTNIPTVGGKTNAIASATTLSNSNFDENKASGTTVASFMTTPTSAYTYSLIAGVGADDNASFSISGKDLKSAASFNYETKTSYKIRIKIIENATDIFTESPFTILINDINEAPTGITLSASTIAENNLANAIIGTLITADVDAGENPIYALVSGTGATDNALFNISGTNLRATNSLNFETKSSYSILIRSTDKGGLTLDKIFIITVSDVNEAPSALIISNNIINEYNKRNAVIGNLSVSDPDSNEIPVYTFVSGTGSNDNALFSLDGNTLKAAQVFYFAIQNSYTVRIRATDNGGLFTESSFIINIKDVAEESTVLAQNLLTPNGDGFNDVWEIPNIEQFQNNEVVVYNRGGKIVYSRKKYQNTWDGSDYSKPLEINKYLPNGTYYYNIILNPGDAPIKGYITILR